MSFRPRHKTARLAPYIRSIQELRQVGWTWEDIRLVLESHNLDIADQPRNLEDVFKRAKKRYDKGDLTPKQIPLPGFEQNQSETPLNKKKNTNQSGLKRTKDTSQTDDRHLSQAERARQRGWFSRDS